MGRPSATARGSKPGVVGSLGNLAASRTAWGTIPAVSYLEGKMQITNGTIKYGRTVKTGDFENKRGDVELSFSVPDGQDAEKTMEGVKALAHKHLHSLLGIGKATAAPTEMTPVPAKPEVATNVAPSSETVVIGRSQGKPPKMPKVHLTPGKEQPQEADPASIEDVPQAPAKAAKPSQDELPGSGSPEVTDADLTSACSRAQQATGNGPGIREWIAKCGVKPPARLIDMPQTSRRAFLDGLKDVKKLA